MKLETMYHPVVNQEIKNSFLNKRKKLFAEHFKQTDSLKFSKEYTFLVEEVIRAIAGIEKYDFVIASAGSFSRRELSPYSDIDLIFIAESIEENSQKISNLVTQLWDQGLEVSHTIRDFSDIQKYLISDLHTFTQFYETRYLLGSEKIYNNWNEQLISTLTPDIKANLIARMTGDLNERYKKHGDSPKVLEPNVKLSAGGLRDFQTVEWMYIFINKTFVNKQQETSQVETFIQLLEENNLTASGECMRLLGSYKFILSIRNLLHLHSQSKTDRFEFTEQIKLARILGFHENDLTDFMKIYFKASSIIHRFTISMIKKFNDDLTASLPASMAFALDDDFELKGNIISPKHEDNFSMSDILRAFYYRGLYSARFDEALRSSIVEKIESAESKQMYGSESSVFFREILKLPRNVGQTLAVMNELGVLGAFMPEFKDLVGFLQHGVYHCYTADEHTLIAIQHVEQLESNYSPLGRIFNKIRDKEKLYLGLIFHDIAKPINIAGHEIIGSEMASSIMHRLGYSDDEINVVSFLVRNHLVMEQTAFRRNLNDPETLNNFTSRINSIEELDLLYLLTYADLSAVNPAVWTSWKSELLSELYKKSKAMLEEKISGEELLYSTIYSNTNENNKFADSVSEDHVKDHIESIEDIAYSHNFSLDEITKHADEIRRGSSLSVLFNETNEFTNVTVITKDFPSLLSKICGVMAINDVNIHDAKIFTRKDGIVIDTFNVTDFHSHKKLEKDKYGKIESDLDSAINGLLQLGQEVASLKSRWRRIESKLFKRMGQVKIAFENHEKYTIIDVHSPDRLGFLYHITSKMGDLGMSIYFAKIATQGDEIVDSFYVLARSGKKISTNDYEFIKAELASAISKIL